MNIFLPCHCSGDHFDFIGIVQLDKHDVEWLLMRKNAFTCVRATDGDLYEMSYWDGQVEWYEVGNGLYKKDHSKLLATITNGEPRVLSSRFRMSKYSAQARVECERLMVDERGFHWKCYPRHTDVRVETSRVEWEVVEP